MNATTTKPATSITTEALCTESLRKVRIVKISSCQNLSESGEITYHIGVSDQGEILFRIHANSSSGYFSREWIPLVGIQGVFAEVAADEFITSYTLHTLFKGKSTNSPGFMLAALLAAGLVQRSTTNDRGYESTDGKEFFTSIQALIESGDSLDPDAKLKKASKKKASLDAPPLA